MKRIIPSDNFKMTNDLLTNKTFGTTLDLAPTDISICESRKKNVYTYVTYVNGTGKPVKLTEFDRAILNVCLAEQAKGNSFTTPKIIFHQLGGGHVLYENMHRKIMQSIEKLATVRIKVDMNEAAAKKMYNVDVQKPIFHGYILPTERIDGFVNGQPAACIKFLSKGTVSTVAELKNQIISCPAELLKLPIRATARTIAINHFLLRRIFEIKGSRTTDNKRVHALRNIITFKDLFDKCNIPNSKRARQQARDSVAEILKNLVHNGVITGFNFEKKDGKFYSITLNL